MKCIVIYYSVSGNTGKIAQAIHKGMGRLADHCDIVAIKGTDGVPGMRLAHLLEYDLIGIGSPIWNNTLPPNVLAFIDDFPSFHKTYLHKTAFEKRLPLKQRKHCFFFLTHGVHPGDGMKKAWASVKGKELTIIGWNDWYGAAFSTWMGKPHAADGHPDDIDLKEAEEFGKQMVERSRRISGGETGLIPELLTGEDYVREYGYYPDRKVYLGAKWLSHLYNVSIDMEKCTRCGLCAEHCPMDNIDLDADSPVLGNCMWCTVCEMVCPTGAVDCEMERVKQNQAGSEGEDVIYERLRGPFFEDIQKRMRPEKRLRALVTQEELGKAGFVADITGHPRLKIPEQGWPPSPHK
jgi:flavodoxin/ferredoxin